MKHHNTSAETVSGVGINKDCQNNSNDDTTMDAITNHEMEMIHNNISAETECGVGVNNDCQIKQVKTRNTDAQYCQDTSNTETRHIDHQCPTVAAPPTQVIETNIKAVNDKAENISP